MDRLDPIQGDERHMGKPLNSEWVGTCSQDIGGRECHPKHGQPGARVLNTRQTLSSKNGNEDYSAAATIGLLVSVVGVVFFVDDVLISLAVLTSTSPIKRPPWSIINCP